MKGSEVNRKKLFLSPILAKLFIKQKNIVHQTFEDPYQELFIWAILTGKIEMVDFFWKRVQTPLIATITAASIYSKLSIFYNKKKNGFKDTDLLSVLKQKHQSRANQVRICVFYGLLYYM